MIRPNSRARAAAISLVVLGVAMLAAGAMLVSMLGGTTGRDLGANAADAAFARAVPVLVVAEILKILTCIAQIVVVRAVAAAAPAPRARLATLVSGIVGALLIGASGVLGLYATASSDSSWAPTVSELGFAGIASTGAFAFVLLSFEAPRLRRWHAGVALLFGIASIAAMLFPPAAFAAGLLSFPFWIGLAGRFSAR